MNVAIIGGGPSGTAAALMLLEAQIPVTLIERTPFPRFRPGETLHPGIEPLLNRLGVADQLHAAGYVRHRGVWSGWDGSMRFVPYGQDVSGPWKGYQAIRADFDHRLLECARTRGATILTGNVSRVLRNASDEVAGVMTSEGPVQATYVMDCSGSSHTLARQLRIPILRYSPQLVARFGYVKGSFDCPTPSICPDQDGWTWIAEVEPQRFQWTRVTEAHRRPDRAWIPQGLRDLEAERTRSADVTWRMAKTVAGPGYFLVGDAAAVVDPCSSHGVLRGIMSGMMAAYFVIRHLAFRTHAQSCAFAYQDWLTSWFLHDVEEMSRAYCAAKLFGFNG